MHIVFKIAYPDPGPSAGEQQISDHIYWQRRNCRGTTRTAAAPLPSRLCLLHPLLFFMLHQKTCIPPATLQTSRFFSYYSPFRVYLGSSSGSFKTQLRQDLLQKDILTLHPLPLASQAGLGAFASYGRGNLVSHSRAGPCWTKRHVHVPLPWDMVGAQ